MKIQKIDLSQQDQLIELFKTDQESDSIEYYIDRKKDFFSPYFWVKPADCIAYGAFEDGILKGMTSLIPLPISFHQGQFPIYLNTDFFVCHKYRKGLAAGKLIQHLHLNAPSSNMIELGIENQPLFLEKIEQISKKYNHTFFWAKETCLTQNFVIHRNSPLELSLQIDSSKEAISAFWFRKRKSVYKNKNWKFKEDLSLSSVKGLSCFKVTDGVNEFAGVFFDRSEYQALRWNGKPKIAIERYRRRLESEKVNFRINDELKFLSLAFCEATTDDADFINKAMQTINNYAFDQNFFCWNIRDFNLPLDKNSYFESVNFKRRISVISNIPNEISFDKEVFYSERNLLESVFL